jgi:hypothetical protein
VLVPLLESLIRKAAADNGWRVIIYFIATIIILNIVTYLHDKWSVTANLVKSIIDPGSVRSVSIVYTIHIIAVLAFAIAFPLHLKNFRRKELC